MDSPPERPVDCLLLDGFNLAFRSFYAVPELNRSDGFPTNALHGWIKTVWRLEDLAPEARMVAYFDLGGDVIRQELHEDYKAQRSEMPEDLARQIPEIKRLTALMGIPVVETKGVEADDLIAGTAAAEAEAGRRVAIVSADKDLAQCVSERVEQWLPPPTANPRLGWRVYDPAAVKERFGVHPHQIAEYLALVGDSSDNIPGLQGVGPKTAARWLQQYGSLQAVMENCGQLQPKRFQQIVHDQKELLWRNLELTRLRAAVPTVIEEPVLDVSRLTAYLEEMEMRRTATEVPKRARYQR